MKRPIVPLALSVLALVATFAAVTAQAAGPYYARGSFYAGGGGTWNADAGNLLYDDGLHEDGAAGDGVYAGDVIPDQPPGFHEFKIANFDWTENWPLHPSYPTDNARLLTTIPGEKVRFRLDLNPRAGWQPVAGAVTCDHGMPAGTVLELMGGAPELGSWSSPVAVVDDGGVWTTVVHIAAPGSYEFKLRNAGNWDWSFGAHYNMLIGSNFAFTTTVPGTAVRFLFDTSDGRGYAAEFDETPARATTWGRVKSLYR